MNIEESINKIKEVIYMSDGEKVDYIDINHSDLGGEVSVDIFIKAIETLLTAYEKEKEANKRLDKEAQGYLEELAGDGSMNIRRIQELEAELEKEKEKNKEYEKQLDLDYAEEKIKEAYIDGTNVAHNLCNKKWVEIIQAQIQELENERKDLVYAQPFVDGQIGVLKRVLKRGEE